MDFTWALSSKDKTRSKAKEERDQNSQVKSTTDCVLKRNVMGAGATCSHSDLSTCFGCYKEISVLHDTAAFGVSGTSSDIDIVSAEQVRVPELLIANDISEPVEINGPELLGAASSDIVSAEQVRVPELLIANDVSEPAEINGPELLGTASSDSKLKLLACGASALVGPPLSREASDH